MSAPSRSRGVPGVGLALGPHGLVAVAAGTRAADPLFWSAPSPGAPRDGGWPELEAALLELRQRIGVRPAVLDAALLPPWSATRVLEFPRLRPHELSAVLRRDARRYFLDARGSQLAAAEVLGSAAKAGRDRVLAAVAPEGLAEAFFETAAAAGWRVRSLVPAHAAWGAAALASPASRLLVVTEDWIEVIRTERGRVSELRRIAGVETSPVDAAVSLAGDPGQRFVIAAQLAARSVQVDELPVPESWTDSPEALAAGFAARASLRFVTRAAGESATRRARRTALGLAAAATVLLCLAASLEVWGARRELAAVRERRREIAPAVREVAKARGTLRALDVRFATLRALEGSAPQWPVVVTMVAQHLPSDARLTAFRAEGDSLLLEGEARRAGRVFDAMADVPGVVAVRAAAPVRREFREGAPPLERFVLSARLGAHRPGTRPGAGKEPVR